MRLISAGFGSFNTNVDDVVLKANGTINWDAIFMFGYKGIGELTQIGKAITRNFYAMEENDKLCAYYQGCSEGGWSRGHEPDPAIWRRVRRCYPGCACDTICAAASPASVLECC